MTGVLMLVMVAWVVLSALIASLFVLLQVVREKIEDLDAWVFEADDSDEWLA